MKKKNILCVMMITILLGAAGQAFGQSGSQVNLGKVLVLYYSWSDSANTERVAGIIRDLTGGDMAKVEPATPFPDLAYRPMTEWVRAQQAAGNYPAIKPLGVDVGSYDFIFIGTPAWYNTLALPLVTLLRETDFRGKPVTVFGTHQGNGSKIMGDFSAQVRNARVVPGELFGHVAGDRQLESKVAAWVRGIQL
ncbi:flavodoxin [Breznakiella homolactica]|uniref:Flavodoxin-like domain-containing protein n=1 Tax=Breznakiella homolactica TaxID=2798577 RepID=A0A7T8B7N6_9SPIR|nr:flavodoxin [Breznakiella homolactica]QQO07699.1 hypothetical protein JFL75_12170 [Breznakiella homolactica]